MKKKRKWIKWVVLAVIALAVILWLVLSTVWCLAIHWGWVHCVN